MKILLCAVQFMQDNQGEILSKIFVSEYGFPDRTRTKRIVRQNVDKQLGGMYFYVEDPSERIDYAG